MTYTIYPQKVVVFDKTTGTILEKHTSSSDVIMIDNKLNRYILAEFDTSSLSVYGQTLRPLQFPVTFNRIPTCDTYSLSATVYSKISASLEVGERIDLNELDFANRINDVSYDTFHSWGWSSNKEEITASKDNKFYVQISCRGTIWDGNIGYTSSDSEFKISNLHFTFDVTSNLTFLIDSSFGGGYHNPSNALNVEVSALLTKGIKQYHIASGALYYKKASEGSYTSVSLTDSAVTLPANTFEDNTDYDLYISAVSDAGTTAQTPVMTLTTTDSTPYAFPVTPYNEITYGNIVFVWDYSVETGADQYAYDIQISNDGGSTWTDALQHVVSSETRATYTQVTTGETLWRVRSYNQNDVAGSWSNSKSYINNVPPQPPVINSISGIGRKTLQWATSQQIAYEVIVQDGLGNVVYDSEEVYTTSKTALINEYLENGQYTFRVRIAAGYGEWSPWAEMQANVSASLDAPVFTVVSGVEGTQITITADPDYDYFYILRNGKPIAKVNGGTYIDRFASGDITYKVIGVGSNDSYGYGTQTVRFIPSSNYLITPDGITFECSQRWGGRIFPSKSTKPEMAAFNFYGNSSPSHMISKKMRSASFSVAVYDENGELDAFLGFPVFFTTDRGWSSWCVITSINRQEQLFGNDTVISLESDSFNVEIDYDL